MLSASVRTGIMTFETLMFPVRGRGCDAAEIIRSRTTGVEFTSSGLPVGGPVPKKICVSGPDEQARRAYPISGVKIHLHKRVPMGAGLGGGSADAACVIRGLSQRFGLRLSISTMASWRRRSAATPSFFIADRPAIATGRGEGRRLRTVCHCRVTGW